MKKVALILAHSDHRIGKIDVLQEYLQYHGYAATALLHPLDDYKALDTKFIDTDGRTETIVRAEHALRNYWEDFRLSIRYIRRLGRVEVFIALDNFDVLPAIFCRRLLRRKVGKIIYYPSDYSGKRFDSLFLNFAYTMVERLAVRYSDLVVSNTRRAERQRYTLGLRSEKSVIIPNGVRMPHPVIFPKKPISKKDFIYVGDVSNEHGLYDLIEILAPSIGRLVIIGSGKDWNRTIAFAKEQGFKLETHYLKNREYVLHYLKQFGGFGLAPYNRSADWTYYCSPVKVGEYIACGVPVLMSDVPEVAEIVREKAYGIVFNELRADRLLEYIEDFNVEDYHLKAKEFYESNNANKLFASLEV